MKIFFIRHGETVDNVNGVYAGSRNSPLTSHGQIQVERLGQYFATQRKLIFDQIHSSDLDRAYKTAQAIRHAQEPCHAAEAELVVQRFTSLREQDFGYYEGRTFIPRSGQPDKPGRKQHQQQHATEDDFQPVESRQSLDERSRSYLQEGLLPLLLDSASFTRCIAIVSHGILLSHLWRAFLRLFSTSDVVLRRSTDVDTSTINLEHLGSWGNTGFLELEVSKTLESHKGQDTAREHCEPHTLRPVPPSSGIVRSDALLSGSKLHILTINGKEHLQGLKRTRGISNARHDESQKKMDIFIKKSKTKV